MGNLPKNKENIIDITSLRKQCEELKDKTDIKDIENRRILYEKILEFDNSNEDDILQYMLSLLELFNRKKIDKKLFQEKLDIYTHGISNENYAKYFPEFPRKNSKTKIFDLLDLIMMDLDNDINYLKKKTFIKEFNELCYTENATKINFKKKISWKNKELYLYNIYYVFLESLNEKINFRKTIKNEKLINNELYKKYSQLLENEKNEEQREKIKTKMEYLNLFEGEFFKIYFYNFKKFLLEIKDNFYIKFKNNNLKDEKDQLLFEDFLQLLSTYEFNGNEDRLISLWNYSFVPITMENKNYIIQCQNSLNSSAKKKKIFELIENNSLNVIEKGNIVLKIDNIDKYDLYTLLIDLSINNIEEYEYYLNKNLLPSHYDTDLFIKKKENFWTQLLINILGSQAIIDCVIHVFGDKENINVLRDQKYLTEEIIKNIRFFIYEAKIAGCLIENSLRIYEYGLFKKNENKSVALLFFYSFNIVTNIHEISGHLFIRTKQFNNNNTNDKSGSPNIEPKDKNLYSNYAQERNKESGESIEIKLFGKRIRELTIKEALFIIEPLNYIKGVKFFAENFKLCNNKNNKEIISHQTEIILNKMDIDFENLPNVSSKKFKFSNYTNLDSSDTTFEQEVLHPPGFYFGRLSKKDFDEMLIYLDLIQDDIKSMNK